jgi:hypothetical protein
VGGAGLTGTPTKTGVVLLGCSDGGLEDEGCDDQVGFKVGVRVLGAPVGLQEVVGANVTLSFPARATNGNAQSMVVHHSTIILRPMCRF